MIQICTEDLLDAYKEGVFAAETPTLRVPQSRFQRLNIRSVRQSPTARHQHLAPLPPVKLRIDFELVATDYEEVEFVEHFCELECPLTVYGKEYVWELSVGEHDVSITTSENETVHCDTELAYLEVERLRPR